MDGNGEKRCVVASAANCGRAARVTPLLINNYFVCGVGVGRVGSACSGGATAPPARLARRSTSYASHFFNSVARLFAPNLHDRATQGHSRQIDGLSCFKSEGGESASGRKSQPT
jgi:hypothetical protein